jgi:hypothetical protein
MLDHCRCPRNRNRNRTLIPSPSRTGRYSSRRFQSPRRGFERVAQTSDGTILWRILTWHFVPRNNWRPIGTLIPNDPSRVPTWISKRKLFIRQGIVRGKASDLKTDASHRAVAILPTVEAALRDQFDSMEGRRYIFSNAWGGPLDLTTIRHRVRYATLARAGLRPRDLYRTRHTFASLMLQASENPA